MEIRRLPDWVKTPYDLELYHSGVKNMKWGNRRYQNKDGSLTPLGRIHYGYGPARATDAGRENTATGIARKAGTSSHIQRQFHSNDSNYALAGLRTDAPKTRGNIKEAYNESLERELSDVYSKLEYTSSTSLHLRGADIRKLSDNGMHWYENDYSHSSLNDKDIDGLRDSEVALIGANYCRNITSRSHTLSKDRARDIGSGNRTNRDALSPYAARREGHDIRDAKDWQDSHIEAFNRLTNNGKNLPKSGSYAESILTSDRNKLRSELYDEKKRRR